MLLLVDDLLNLASHVEAVLLAVVQTPRECCLSPFVLTT